MNSNRNYQFVTLNLRGIVGGQPPLRDTSDVVQEGEMDNMKARSFYLCTILNNLHLNTISLV